MKNFLFVFISIILFSCSKQSAQTVTSTSTENNSTTSTIQFSGYTWNVKNGSHLGPGPNNWSRNNVWVDASGFLHLKITKDTATGKWYCAEVSTQQTFGFGKWQFWVEGRIDKMDKNVVLGLFNYSGNDGFDEMDIEWARWGNNSYPNCNYTVWPATTGFNNYSYTEEVALTGKNTTQRFTRTDSSVSFQSLQGFTNNTGSNNILASATCTNPPNSISTLAMPAYINLWLFQGHAPINGKEVEIIIHKFSYNSPS
jgi:hypothetical protein